MSGTVPMPPVDNCSRLLTCALCGAEVTYLGQHLALVHAMTGKAYRRMFPGARMCGAKILEYGARRAAGRETVVCAICQRPYRQITATHLRFHGLSVPEYRERFPAAPLNPSDVTRRVSEAARMRVRRQHQDPAFRAALQRGIRKVQHLGWARTRQLATDPAHIQRLRERGLAQWARYSPAEQARISQAGAVGRMRGQRYSHQTAVYRDRAGRVVNLYSRLELVTAYWLDRSEVPWMYEATALTYTYRGTQRTCVPDFTIPGGFVEAKGRRVAILDPTWRAKFAAMRPRLYLMTSDDMKELGLAPMYNWLIRTKRMRSSWAELQARYASFVVSPWSGWE